MGIFVSRFFSSMGSYTPTLPVTTPMQTVDILAPQLSNMAFDLMTASEDNGQRNEGCVRGC